MDRAHHHGARTLRARRDPCGAFDYSDTADRFQFGVDLPWIEAINANYHIGVDGISLPLVVLSALITCSS